MLRTNVINMYLAMRGMLSDVGGRIFETRSRNTTNASRMDIVRVI
jgi:hypothetical protein